MVSERILATLLVIPQACPKDDYFANRTRDGPGRREFRARSSLRKHSNLLDFGIPHFDSNNKFSFFRGRSLIASSSAGQNRWPDRELPEVETALRNLKFGF